MNPDLPSLASELATPTVLATAAVPDWVLLPGLLLVVSAVSVLGACRILGIRPLPSRSGASGQGERP